MREQWQPARLLPTVGIRGQEEQERRATSALLAVMRAVPEFGHALLKELGAPKSLVIQTFTEVRFKDGAGRTVIPDGAIVCERGRRSWACLLEVKTGTATLRDEQVAAYLDLAREQGFDAVLTISNQITGDASESPVVVDGRKLRRVGLYHFSWWRVITEAIVQSRYRGISDPDQAWILDELIAYLNHDASGAGGFSDMGRHWVAVRKSAHDGTLRPCAEATEIAQRWNQFTHYVCMALAQDLGERVRVVRPRKQTTAALLDATVTSLVETGVLETVLRVPGAIGDLRLEADLRTRQTRVSVTFPAPTGYRARGRIGWLMRQLRDAPADLRIDVAYPNARQTVAALVEDVRDAPERLFYEPDPRREARTFTLTSTRKLGHKRGRSEGSFVRETRQHVIDFYGELVQKLKRWQPRAPQLREVETDEHADEPAADGERPQAHAGDRARGHVTDARASAPPTGLPPSAGVPPTGA